LSIFLELDSRSLINEMLCTVVDDNFFFHNGLLFVAVSTHLSFLSETNSNENDRHAAA
jgi:hypothetical protein